MAEPTFIQVRIDKELKQRATDVLDSIGMDMPNAIRMFLTRVVIENGLPFEAKLPANARIKADHTQEPDKSNNPIVIPAEPAKYISMAEYVGLLQMVPTGKLTRMADIEHYFENKYKVSHIRIDYSANTDDPFWDKTPIWREVSMRGMLANRTICTRETQAKKLESEGFRLVPCGANQRSLKVENYRDYLFDFTKL